MRELWGPVVFFGIKFLAYTGYCKLGMSGGWKRAAGLAGARMLAGLVVGMGVMQLMAQPAGSGNRLGMPELFGSWVWTYLLVYGVLRAGLWGAMGWYAGRGWVWTAGGVGLSFAVDAVGFAAALTVIGGIC